MEVLLPESPSRVSPDILGQISEEKVRNNSLHLIRITFMDPKFPPDNGLSPFLPHIQSEITVELCKTSAHSWGPHPWSMTFPTENIFNLMWICHYLIPSCLWSKVLCTVSEQPIRHDCKRWIPDITLVVYIKTRTKVELCTMCRKEIKQGYLQS